MVDREAILIPTVRREWLLQAERRAAAEAAVQRERQAVQREEEARRAAKVRERAPTHTRYR